MALHTDVPRVAMQVSRGVVVASIQVDLEDDVLAQFREDLLGRIHETGSNGVILDVSGLEMLDSEEFAALRRIISMTDLMGAKSVLVGLRPGVVSSLIEAGADVDGLEAAVSLDVAFAQFVPETEPESRFGDAPEAEEVAPPGDLPFSASEETPEVER
jgi:rsbT antagonist protein RsbS